MRRMRLVLIRLLAGWSIVEYIGRRRAESRQLGPAGSGLGWLISGDEDTPARSKNDLPDEIGARWLRDLESSRALRLLSDSYRRQPIQASVADED